MWDRFHFYPVKTAGESLASAILEHLGQCAPGIRCLEVTLIKHSGEQRLELAKRTWNLFNRQDVAVAVNEIAEFSLSFGKDVEVSIQPLR